MSSPASADPASTAAALPPCAVCGSTHWPPPWPGTRLRPCPQCGTLLHDRAADRHEEERLYDHCTSLTVRHQDEVAVGQWQWAAGLLVDTAQPAVLDVGCGMGHFLLAAQRAGATVAGLELDPVGVAACREAGIPVTAGSLFDAGVPRGPWDLITLWDVLDHLDEPGLALRLLVAELRPGGWLVVRGRNAALHGPLKRLRATRPSTWGRLPDLAVVHRWGFRPAGWRRLLRDAGLEPVRLYPGRATPGDRYGSFQRSGAARLLKGAVSLGGEVVYRLTGGAWYPFVSTLAAGRKPDETRG